MFKRSLVVNDYINKTLMLQAPYLSEGPLGISFAIFRAYWRLSL